MSLTTDAAPTPRGRSQAAATSAPTASAPVSARAGRTAAPVVSSARSAVSARSGVRTAPAATAATPAVSARAGRTNAQVAAPVVSARSATNTKNVSIIQKSVSVNAATQGANLVNEECRTRWFGCMDMFCILGNENGMRCSCSDTRKGFDALLAEIDSLNDKIKAYGASALEKVKLTDEQRAYIDEQMAKANADMSVDSTAPTQAGVRQARSRDRISDFQDRFANLSLESVVEEEDIELPDEDNISNYSGDALYRRAAQMCRAEMNGCEGDMNMIQVMYTQNITSDCKAFEIELSSRQKKASDNYRVVEAGVREAALERFEEENKYNLGECVVEYRKCMMGPDVCGEDWTACATNIYDQAELAAKNTNIKPWEIGGIQLSAMTKLNMENRKGICARVTDGCISADGPNRDQVWANFLNNVAAELRVAELQSEAFSRQSCLTDISECVQRTCQAKGFGDTDETDMNACLTDRNIARENCKIGLDGKMGVEKCEAMIPGLWEFLDAKLSSMRVGVCMDAVRAALQDDDVCGEDYSNCAGMTTDSVLNMIVRKGTETDVRQQNDTVLVACRDTGGNYSNGQYTGVNYADAGATAEKIKPFIQGILTSMISAIAQVCEAEVDKEMAKVCGSATDCSSAFANNTSIGAYDFDCGNTGLNKVSCTMTDTGALDCGSSTDTNQQNFIDSVKQLVNGTLNTIKTTKVRQCVEGNSSMGEGNAEAIPYLLNRYAEIIADSASKKGLENYQDKIEELSCPPPESLPGNPTNEDCASDLSNVNPGQYCGAGNKVTNCPEGKWSIIHGANDASKCCPMDKLLTYEEMNACIGQSNVEWVMMNVTKVAGAVDSGSISASGSANTAYMFCSYVGRNHGCGKNRYMKRQIFISSKPFSAQLSVHAPAGWCPDNGGASNNTGVAIDTSNATNFAMMSKDSAGAWLVSAMDTSACGNSKCTDIFWQEGGHPCWGDSGSMAALMYKFNAGIRYP